MPSVTGGTETGPVRVAKSGAALLAAFAAGVAMSVQSRLNAGLAADVANPYIAAAWSFGSGLVVALVLCLAVPSGRAGFGRLIAAVRERRVAWWMLLGGLVGAFYVASQGIAAAVIGIALFTVAGVAGQSLGGLLFDRIGLAGLTPKAITIARALSTGVAILAVVVASWGHFASDSLLWLAILPFIAGVGMGFQQAVNGRVRTESGSPLVANVVNFLGGTIVLVVIAGVSIAFAGWPVAGPSSPWLLLGGVVGNVAVLGQVLAVRRLGALVLTLSLIAGQLVAALVVDMLAPVSSHPFDWLTVAGTAIAFAAVAIATIPSRRVRPRA
jgi:transporter family-2 protein